MIQDCRSRHVAWYKLQQRIRAAKQRIRREVEESFTFPEAGRWPTMMQFDALRERVAAQTNVISQSRDGFHIGTFVTLVRSARECGGSKDEHRYAVTIDSYYQRNQRFYVMQDEGNGIIINGMPDEVLREIEHRGEEL